MSLSTLNDAQQVARRFLALEKVQAVYLFGSVARNQKGDDIDMILVVSETDAQEFFGGCGDQDEDSGYFNSDGRYYAAVSILGLSTWDDIFEKGDGLPGDREQPWFTEVIDAFLFPPNWLTRLEELQKKFGHSDPGFMRNIAQDARRFDPRYGIFRPVAAYAKV